MAFTIEKTWEHLNNLCVVIMNHYTGTRCGYVGIKPDHPLFGQKYFEKSDFLFKFKEALEKSSIDKKGIIPLLCYDGESISPDIFFNVHGGLTYSGGAGYPIEKENIWWFGFDCNHFNDGSKTNPFRPVRSLDYCIKECESLSQQLEDIKEK
jgi:hypothetical protein